MIRRISRWNLWHTKDKKQSCFVNVTGEELIDTHKPKIIVDRLQLVPEKIKVR